MENINKVTIPRAEFDKYKEILSYRSFDKLDKEGIPYECNFCKYFRFDFANKLSVDWEISAPEEDEPMGAYASFLHLQDENEHVYKCVYIPNISESMTLEYENEKYICNFTVEELK